MTGHRYGLKSAQCRDLLTFQGRVIVHHSREQLEWLCPGATAVEIDSSTPVDQCIPIQFVPAFGSTQFGASGDLERSQFRATS